MTDCEEWPGSFTRNGYGQKWNGVTMVGAHRWVWEQVFGPIPNGLQVHHACDNQRCVRLDHLWLGTQADNMRDKANKGRHHNQKKAYCPQGHPYDHMISGGERKCRACNAVAASRYRAAKRGTR